jgi:AcrR family transcriptional regulator
MLIVMARPRSEAARQRLLDAALAIVATDGVAAVTADAVARRSGVARTTLYRHFGSTEALVFAAVADSVTAQAPPDTGTLRGDLQVIQRRYLDVASSRRSRELFAWMVAKSVESAEYRELFRRARVQPRGPTTVALQRAIARGEIAADIDVDLAMHLIQGPLISQRIVDDRDVSDSDLERMLDMTVRALGVVEIPQE